jgi:hypothetical protein
VLFDLFNEPYPESNRDSTAAWNCVLNGGCCSGVNFPIAGMQQFVNVVRATGATQPLTIARRITPEWWINGSISRLTPTISWSHRSTSTACPGFPVPAQLVLDRIHDPAVDNDADGDRRAG